MVEVLRYAHSSSRSMFGPCRCRPYSGYPSLGIGVTGYSSPLGSEEDVPHNVRFRATGFPGTNYSVCWDPLQTLRVHVYECNHGLQAVRASLRATPSASAECSDPIPDRWESLDVQVRFVKKNHIKIRKVRVL